MGETTTEKLNWFGILKMSGLMISEVIYRKYFKDASAIDTKEHFILRKLLNRFNSGSYSVNKLVGHLFFELLNHDSNRWKTGKEARAYAKTEPDHFEKLYPDFILDSREKDKPAFVIKALDEKESLDKRKPSGSGTWRASEHIKFETLLRLLNCPLGLLTNGTEFRLFYAEEGHSAAYISWNQNDWIEEKSTFEAFKNLLNEKMLLPDTSKGIYKLIKESHEKQAEVTDALADQVFTVINIILDYINQSKINVEPGRIYEAVIKIVMRLVFVLYAEENNLLPHGFPEYDDNYGLIHLANSLEAERSNLGSDFDTKASYRYDAWYRILALFNLIYYGSDHPELKITKHGGDLFSPEGVNEIFEHAKITNKGVRDILYNLLYMKGLRLSYAAIDVEQIGYVYEGLLGYTVSRAKEDLVVTAGEKFILPLRELEKRSPKEIKELMKNVDKKTEKKVPEKFPESNADTLQARAAKFSEILAPEEERIIPEGSYYMSASGARKSTGSYYTPKPLTSYLVKETLKPLCTDENGKAKSSSEILSLKVVDPAMGSGAFLVQATDYLSDKLLKSWENEGINTELSDEEREILAKRNIVEHCIYGVDINPIAVELAKMSLWLNTFSKDKPFTFLDHKLKCGNSLIGVFHGLDDIDIVPKDVFKTSKNMSKEWKSQIASLRKLNNKYKPDKKVSSARNQSTYLNASEILDDNFRKITDDLSTVSKQIDVTGKETEDYFAKQQIYKERFLENREYIKEKTKADVWTAQWFANEIDNVKPLTTGELNEIYHRLENSANQLAV
ncbi:MAG: N-6 DNA methylase, partial [Kosmotogaceae bacterium]